MSETETRAPVTALDRYRTVTVGGETFHVAKYGWPVETCGRCGGCGEYSYCQMYGTRCFGCEGKGVTLATGKVSDIRAEYRAAVDKQKLRRTESLQPGDEIRDWNAPKDAPFRRVRSVTPTDRRSGSQKIGSAPEEVFYYQQVTFEDGETVEFDNYVRGRITEPRAPYVEAAQKAMAAKIKSRRSAAARRARQAADPAPAKPAKKRPARVNQYPGKCTGCNGQVAEGAGTWSRDTGVRHAEGACEPARV